MLGERIAIGASADLYAFEPGRVVKLFRPEYAGAAHDEAERTRAVHEAGLPCPAVHGVVVIDGRTGIVLDHVAGPSLMDAIADGSQSIDAAVGTLAAVHFALHASAPAGLPTWREVAATVSASLDDLDRCDFERTVGNVPDGDRAYHGDLHPGNVILSPGGPVVVDWPNACRAHPAIDVARSLVLLRYQALEPGSDPAVVAARRQFADAYVNEYCSLNPIARDIQRGLPLHAMGRLRDEPNNPCIEELRALAVGRADPFLESL